MSESVLLSKANSMLTISATAAATSPAPAIVIPIPIAKTHAAKPVNRVSETAAYLSAQEAHARLRQSLTQMFNAEKSVFRWFSEICRRKFYREFGHASIQAYAAEELDFTPNRTNRYLKLIADLEQLPRIRNALEYGKLGWTKAQVIAKVSSPATEAQWLEAALRLNRRDLEAKVDKAQKQARARRKRDPKQPNLTTCNHPGSGHSGSQMPGQPQHADSSEERGRPSRQADSDEERGHTPRQADSSEERGRPSRHADSGEQHGPTQLQADSSDRGWLTEGVAGEETLIDDGPVSIGFRLTPVELVRYEAQIEKIRKLGVVNPGASPAEILLAALDELIISGSLATQGAQGGDRDGNRSGNGNHGGNGRGNGNRSGNESRGGSHAGVRATCRVKSKNKPEIEPTSDIVDGNKDNVANSESIVRRRTSVTTYQIVIYKCEKCQAAVVQTGRGTKEIDRKQLKGRGV